MDENDGATGVLWGDEQDALAEGDDLAGDLQLGLEEQQKRGVVGLGWKVDEFDVGEQLEEALQHQLDGAGGGLGRGGEGGEKEVGEGQVGSLQGDDDAVIGLEREMREKPMDEGALDERIVVER